jgi:hypothetical protein
MTPPCTVTVQFDPGSDPIAGSVTDDRGTRDFSGWLEFAVALHGALEEQAPDDVSSA